MEKEVAILGAGLTGLTTAFYLKKKGIPFRVFDTKNRAGGVIETQTDGDFIWERGPNTGVLSRVEAVELFEDLSGELLETAGPLAKKRYIWKGKKLHALPASPIAGLLTPLFSWKDKWGILLEPFRKKGDDPEENLSSFVKRRLGKSILDYAVDPFVSGVYAGDPDYIIPKYALPKLYALEEKYGSFIRGTIGKMREPKGERTKKVTKKTFSAVGGLSHLIERLVLEIGEENLTLGVKNLTVSPGENLFYVCGENFKEAFSKVVFTGGAHRLNEAFPFLEAEGFSDASKITYSQVMEVAVGFKNWKGKKLDGFGALMPSKEKRNILGILFMSSLFCGRAPEAGALLTIFIGGARHPEYLELSDREIFEKVKKDVSEALLVPEFKPDLFEINRHRFAIPQYDKLTPRRMQAFAAVEARFPGLIVAGNGIGGIGMADRIRQGRELAERLAKEGIV